MNREEWQGKFQDCEPGDNAKSMSKYFWWTNPINRTSMRLTPEGYTRLALHKWQFYKFKITDYIIPKNLLQLERGLVEPYYLQNRSTLHLTSSSEAMMLALYANDLNSYLTTLNS